MAGSSLFCSFIWNMWCLCHYSPALLRFWFQTDCLAAGEEVDHELIAKFIEITVRSSTRERWQHVKQQQQSSLHAGSAVSSFPTFAWRQKWLLDREIFGRNWVQLLGYKKASFAFWDRAGAVNRRFYFKEENTSFLLIPNVLRFHGRDKIFVYTETSV